MSSDAAHTAMTGASGDTATVTSPASLTAAGEAIPRLPDHLVVEHILRTEHFDDPADLARLPAVSRAMRDAVAETGVRFEELDEKRAAELGCVSALKRLQRRGGLSRQERLCEAAARGGNLEELQVLRADGCPWDANTCSGAAKGGHIEVIKWAIAEGCQYAEETHAAAASSGNLEVLQYLDGIFCRASGTKSCAAAALKLNGHLHVLKWMHEVIYVWDELTRANAAAGGHLEVLLWLRANGCPSDEKELDAAAHLR